MPTVLRAGPYRFFFYASDRPEPPHIRVEREPTGRSSGWNRSGSNGAVDSDGPS